MSKLSEWIVIGLMVAAYICLEIDRFDLLAVIACAGLVLFAGRRLLFSTRRSPSLPSYGFSNFCRFCRSPLAIKPTWLNRKVRCQNCDADVNVEGR